MFVYEVFVSVCTVFFFAEASLSSAHVCVCECFVFTNSPALLIQTGYN